MKVTRRVGAGLVAGFVTAVAIALAATILARSLWPDYAAAQPATTYTLLMLIARLSVGAFGTAGAAWITTIIARDKGAAACWLGAIFLVLSLPVHLYREWADYPAWYHALYLSYLVPIAGLTGRVSGRCSGAQSR